MANPARLILATLVGLPSLALFATSALAQDATTRPPVAMLGSQPITANDLGPTVSQKLQSIAKTYARKRVEADIGERTATQDALSEATEQYLNNRVLELEAKATHKSKEALLAAIKPGPVSSDELHRAYDEHAREINRPFGEVEAELRKAVESERRTQMNDAYYATLRKKYDARILVEPARLTVSTKGPSIGPADARVTIVLFSDLECPYCQRVIPTLRETLARYPKDVRLVYRHLPLTGLHAHAAGAAESAVCADRQGKFWPFVDALFAEQRKLGTAFYESTATKLGMNAQTFAACVKGSEAKAVVDADTSEAEELGLASTPAMLINGRMIRGAVPVSTITKMVDEELDRH